MREKSLQNKNNSQWFSKAQNQTAKIYIIITVLLFLLLYLSLAVNIIVYTPNQGKNGEKYFNHIFYKGKDADSGGN